MPCKGSSKHLLQSFITLARSSSSVSEPLPFLYPNFSSQAPRRRARYHVQTRARQVGLATAEQFDDVQDGHFETSHSNGTAAPQRDRKAEVKNNAGIDAGLSTVKKRLQDQSHQQEQKQQNPARASDQQTVSDAFDHGTVINQSKSQDSSSSKPKDGRQASLEHASTPAKITHAYDINSSIRKDQKIPRITRHRSTGKKPEDNPKNAQFVNGLRIIKHGTSAPTLRHRLDEVIFRYPKEHAGEQTLGLAAPFPARRDTPPAVSSGAGSASHEQRVPQANADLPDTSLSSDDATQFVHEFMEGLQSLLDQQKESTSQTMTRNPKELAIAQAMKQIADGLQVVLGLRSSGDAAFPETAATKALEKVGDSYKRIPIEPESATSRQQPNTERTACRSPLDAELASADLKKTPESDTVEFPTAEMLDADADGTERLSKFYTSYMLKYAMDRTRESAIRHKGDSSHDFKIAHRLLCSSLMVSRSSEESSAGKIVTADKFDGKIEQRSYRCIMEDIPKPIIWTRLSFAQYVRDLACARVPLHLNRKLHKQHGLPDHHRIRQCFEQSLFVPQNKELMSSFAVETATKFYIEHEMLDSLRQLYSFLKETSLDVPHGLYEIALRNAALKIDLHTFTSMLGNALKLGFAPTADTWASLVIAVESSDAQNELIEFMKTNGLLVNRKVRQDIAFAVLRYKLWAPSEQHAADAPLSFDLRSIVQEMDKTFGENWLSSESHDLLLERQCFHPSGQNLLEAIEILGTRRDISPFALAYILLKRCRQLGDVSTALKILPWSIQNSVKGEKKNIEAISEDIINTIFQTAWYVGAFNVCKVLWTWCCVHCLANDEMTSKLYNALLLTRKEVEHDVLASRDYNLARYIAGVGVDKHVPTQFVAPAVQQDPQSTLPSSTALIEALSTKSPTPKAYRKEKAQTLLKNDQDLYLHAQFGINNLLIFLRHAWYLDQALLLKHDRGFIPPKQVYDTSLQLRLSRRKVFRRPDGKPFTAEPVVWVEFRERGDVPLRDREYCTIGRN